MIFSCLVFTGAKTETSAATFDSSDLVALKKKFPNGKYWNHVGSSKNNPDGYTSTPCTHHGSKCSTSPGSCACNSYNGAIQCMGYAHKIAYEITGSNVGSSGWKKSYTLKASSLCVGDEIRYLNNRHSIVVVGISGNTIAYTGANWGGNCLIKWGTMKISDIRGFSYIYHYSGNSRHDSDIDYVEENTSAETWKTKDENDAVLNIRNGYNTSSKVIGTIPVGQKFTVTSSKFWDGTYLWGEVQYGSIKGYAALNYAIYVSGGKDKVDVKDILEVYAGSDSKFTWNAVDGANKYTITVKNSSGKVVETKSTDKTYATLVLPDAGKHYVTIVATNTNATTWKVSSGSIEFSVLASKSKYIEKITVEKTLTIGKGQTDYIEVSYSPNTAGDDLAWYSTNMSVATVSSSGKVTALGYGTAKIVAYSKNDSTIKSTCTVTVGIGKLTGLKQTSTGTSATSIGLKWNSVSGASGYRIYIVKSDGSLKKVADVTKTSTTIKGLSAGTTYKFVGKAYRTVDGKVTLGAQSDKVTLKTTPSAPKNLKCTDRTTSGYKLKWSSVSGAYCYYVYRLNKSNNTWTKISTEKTTSISLKGEDGKAFRYTVSAVFKIDGSYFEGKKASAVYGYRAGNRTGTTTAAKTETWITKKDNDAAVNIRKSPSTSADVVGGIEPNAKFTVTEKKWDGTYLWGKIKYNSVTGWCVLNFAKYVSGGKDNIKLSSSTGIFPKTSYKIQWNKVAGANKYVVKVYNSSKKEIASSGLSSAACSIKLPSAGTYYIKIVATNTNTPNWKVSSGMIKVYALKKA